jgi:hypothetical protein
MEPLQGVSPDEPNSVFIFDPAVYDAVRGRESTWKRKRFPVVQPLFPGEAVKAVTLEVAEHTMHMLWRGWFYFHPLNQLMVLPVRGLIEPYNPHEFFNYPTESVCEGER